MTELSDLHTPYGAAARDWPEAIKLVRYAAPVQPVEPAEARGMRHYTVTAVGPVSGQRSVGVYPAADMMQALCEAQMNCEPFGWRVVEVREGLPMPREP